MSEEIPNLGVIPRSELPSREEHQALAHEIEDEAKANMEAGVYKPPPRNWRPEPVPPPPPVEMQAAEGKGSEARRNLLLSGMSGFGPVHVSEDPQGVEVQAKQEELEKILPLAPALSSFAGRSPVHAAAVGDDAGPLAGLEGSVSPGPLEYKQYGASYGTYGSFLQKGILETWANLQRLWLSIQRPPEAGSFLTGEPTPDQAEKLQKMQESIKETEKEAETMVPEKQRGSYLGRVIEAAPGVVGIMAGEYLGGPAGNAAFLYSQSFGSMHRELENDSRFTPEEKVQVAAVTSFVSSLIGSGAGQRFASSLIPAELRNLLQGTAAHALVSDVLARPAWKTVLMEGGKNVLSGTLMNVGMDLTESLALEIGRANREGRPVNGSYIWNRTKNALEGSLVLIPYGLAGPLREHADSLGRWTNSERDASRLRSAVESVKESKLAQENPEQAKELIKSMPGEPTVYVDAAAWEKSRGPDDPPPPGGSVATGAAVAVPREDFLVSSDAEKLLKDSKLDPDGLTPRESPKEADRLAAERDLLQWQRGMKLPIAREGDEFTYKRSDGITITFDGENVNATGPDGLTAGVLSLSRVIPDAATVFPATERRGEGAIKPDRVYVNPQYRRRGLATDMYRMVEQIIGEKIVQSSVQTDEGKAFRTKYDLERDQPPGVKPKAYAEVELETRKIGEMDGLRVANERAERSANSQLLKAQEKGLKAAERGLGQAQAGVEAGIEAGQEGRGAALSNMEFARIARMREWLKGLVMPKGRTPTQVAKTAEGVERWKTETGLYNIPQLKIEVEKTEAEKWYEMGEATRARAIQQFKASKKAESTAEDRYVRSVNEEVKAGDEAAAARAYRAQRDTAYALKNAMRRGAEEGRKIDDFLTVRADDGYRVLFGRAGREYRQGYDAIFEALGKRNPGPGGDVVFDDVIQRMRDDGVGEIGFDVDAIKDLIKNPRGIEDMTLAEARNVRDAVKALRKAARDALEIKIGGQREQLRQRVMRVAEHLSLHPSGGDKMGGMRAELHRPELLLKELGMEDVHRDYVKSRNDYEVISKEIGDHLQEHLSQVPKEILEKMFDPVEGPKSPPEIRGLPSPWTRADLYSLGAWMGSESGKQGAVDGLRVPEAEIWRVLDQLTPDEWHHMVDGVRWKLGAKMWEKIKTHVENSSGVEPEETVKASPVYFNRTEKMQTPGGATFDRYIETVILDGGYTPRQWVRESMQPATPGTVGEAWGMLRDGIVFMGKPFLKPRSEGFSAVPNFDFGAYAAHLNRISRVLAYEDFIKNFGRILKDPEFRNIAQDKWGQNKLDQLDSWHQTVARGYVEPAAGGAQQWNRIAGSLTRSRAGTAAFQLNLPVTLMQFSHIPATMFGMGIGPKHVAYGLSSLFLPQTWRTAHAESTQLQYRWNDYGRKTREMLYGMQQPSGFGKWMKENFPNTYKADQKLMDYIDAVGWSTFKFTDAIIGKVIYEGAKSQALARHATPEEAIHAADEAVSLGMPARNIAEQSAFTRDKGFIGSLSLVHNFPNTLENMAELRLWQAKTNIWNSQTEGWARVRKIGGEYAIGGSLILGMLWSAHIFGRWLGGHGKDADEDYSDYFTRQALTALLYPFPILGPMAEQTEVFKAVEKRGVGAGLRAVADLAPPPMAFIGGQARGVGKVFDDRLDFEDRFYAGSEVLMKLRGIPIQPFTHAKFIFDSAIGKIRVTDDHGHAGGPTEYGSGLVYPRSLDKSGGPRRQTPITDLAKVPDAATNIFNSLLEKAKEE